MTQVADTTKGPDPKVDSPSDSKTELLIRQVEMKVAQEGEHTDAAASVSFGKLFSAANTTEKVMIYGGWFFAAVTGSILPLFFFYIGPIFDSFGAAGAQA